MPAHKQIDIIYNILLKYVCMQQFRTVDRIQAKSALRYALLVKFRYELPLQHTVTGISK